MRSLLPAAILLACIGTAGADEVRHADQQSFVVRVPPQVEVRHARTAGQPVVQITSSVDVLVLRRFATVSKIRSGPEFDTNSGKDIVCRSAEVTLVGYDSSSHRGTVTLMIIPLR